MLEYHELMIRHNTLNRPDLVKVVPNHDFNPAKSYYYQKYFESKYSTKNKILEDKPIRSECKERSVEYTDKRIRKQIPK